MTTELTWLYVRLGVKVGQLRSLIKSLYAQGAIHAKPYYKDGARRALIAVEPGVKGKRTYIGSDIEKQKLWLSKMEAGARAKALNDELAELDALYSALPVFLDALKETVRCVLMREQLTNKQQMIIKQIKGFKHGN